MKYIYIRCHKTVHRRRRVMAMMFLTLILIGECCLLAAAFNDEGALDIAAFNVQVFGIKKMGIPEVRKYLKNIILRYDLILIQEIRDRSGKAIEQLLAYVKAEDPSYKMELSPRLGRTTSKEQYAFIYRSDWLTATLHSPYTYLDPDDVFEREPYIVRFHSSLASITDFAVAGIHTSPENAEKEISALATVYDDIVAKWKLQDVIIMGDFNAGCNYVKNWKNIKLATDKRFYWIIDNSKHTTSKNTECPYDRIVVAGSKLLKSIIPLSGGIFNYKEEYGLTQEETEYVSDHFPVQLQIRTLTEEKEIISSQAIYSNDKRVTHYIAESTANFYSMNDKAVRLGKYAVSYTYTKSGEYLGIVVAKTVNGLVNVFPCLEEYKVDFPDFFTLSLIYNIRRQLKMTDMLSLLPKGHGRYNTLYDYYKSIKKDYSIKLKCDRLNPSCIVQVE